MKERNMNLKKFVVKAASAVGIMSMAFPAAVLAAGPTDWMQRYDITVIEPGTVANYVQRYRIEVVNPVHLSLSATDVTIPVTPNAATPATGTAVATVKTDWSNGYTLYISGDDELVCASDGTYKIPTVSATGALPVNRWGVGVGADGSTPPASWKGVSAADLMLAETSAPSVGGTAGVGDAYNVFFGVKVDGTMLACDYEGEMLFTAVKK